MTVLLAAGIIAALWASPAGAEDEASTDTPPNLVSITFRTIDGDARLRGPGLVAMADRKLTVRDAATGEAIASLGPTGTDGIATLTEVDDALRLTVTATAPDGYVTFPVAVNAWRAAGRTIDVPLYRSSQQWLTWGKGLDRRRVGPAAGKPKGDPLWTIDPGNSMEFPPSVAYGTVAYGSYRGILCVNDLATGKLRWRRHLGAPYGTSSRFANQVAVGTWKKDGAQRAFVYYAVLTGIVGCRDLMTGEPVWEIRGAQGPGTEGAYVPFQSIESSPLIVGDSVYFCTRYDAAKGSQAGLWALDKRTGEVRFFRRLARTGTSKIASSPAYRSGRVFVATYDGVVCAISRWTGRILWRKRLGGQFYSTPAVSGSRLFIGNKSNGSVYCLDTASGRTVWRTGRLGESVHSSPAVYGDKVFVGAGWRFYALRSTSGRVAWSRPTLWRMWGSASVLDGVVYYSCPGRTYARDVDSGRAVSLPEGIRDVGRYSPVTANRHVIVVTGARRFSAYLTAY